MAFQFTEENFEQEVLKSNELVVVDFYADWCGPCKMVGPIIEQLAAEQTGVKIGKLNVDNAQEIAAKYKVMSIPTILYFKNGEVVHKIIGLKSKEEFQAMINKLK